MSSSERRRTKKMNTCSNRRRTREVKVACQIAITLCWRRNLQSQATANTSKSFYSLYSLFLLSVVVREVLFSLLCLLFVSHHLFKGAKILTTITTNSSRSLSIHLSIIYLSSSSSNETDANRACTNIHQRKGTTSIQSPRERRLKTCQKTGTARCAARPSQSSNPSADKSLASNKTKVTGLERTV